MLLKVKEHVYNRLSCCHSDAVLFLFSMLFHLNTDQSQRWRRNRGRALQRQRFANEEVLGELLAFHSASAGCGDSEIGIQQTCNCLYRIEFTVSIEGEPDDVSGILIPRHVGADVHQSSGDFGKGFFNETAFARQHNPFAEIGTDVNGQALPPQFRLVGR